MHFHRISLSLALAGLALTCAPDALAQDASSLMRQADAANAAGHASDAAKLYDSAAQAFARAGNQSAAADAFEKEANILIAAPAQAPAPAPAANYGTPQPRPAAQPQPQPQIQQAKGAIPDGLYNCHGVGGNTLFAVIGRVAIKGTAYVFYTENDRDKLPGTYSWPGGTKIKWTSGFLSNKTDADWEFDDLHSQMRLSVYTSAKGAPWQNVLTCFHSDMTPP